MACLKCGAKPLHIENPAEYRRRKIANVKASMAKAKKNGTKIGRPRKIDYKDIVYLRKKGFSYSKIAALVKTSIGSVQRALKLAALEEK